MKESHLGVFSQLKSNQARDPRRSSVANSKKIAGNKKQKKKVRANAEIVDENVGVLVCVLVGFNT